MFSLDKIKVFSLTLALLFFANEHLFAQSDEDKELANQFIEIAEEIMRSTQAEDQALESYIQAATFDPSNIKANFMAGYYYLRNVNKDQASQYFLKVKELDPKYRFDIDYLIGQSYQYGTNFEKATEYYHSYNQKLSNIGAYKGEDVVSKKDVDQRLKECENAIEFRKNPRTVKIENLGREVNSEFDDFAPVITSEEDFLVFTSKRRDGNLNDDVDDDNKPFEDIFFTRKSGDSWGYAQNIGRSVNTKTHDSNLAISADGNTLFIYKVVNNGDIYVTTRKQDTLWTQPKSISDNINSEGFKESSVSISPDGNTLYFASNRPGGIGGTDIFYSTLNNQGEWNRARSVGEVINTEFDEDGPFIDYDGKTLYFSSRGHKGMGRYDIFKSVYDSAAQTWSKPVNIGYPINTPDDDIYFVSTKDGRNAYYASVRSDGYGFTDLYKITFLDDEPTEEPDEEIVENPVLEEDSVVTEEPEVEVPKENPSTPVVVSVTVQDAGTGEPIDAKVSLKSIDNNTEAGLEKPAPGEFSFTVKTTASEKYRLSVESVGYVYETTDITIPAMTADDQKINRTIRLRKPVVNTRKVLRNLYFDVNKATFKQASFDELNKLHQMMTENTGITIEISGHTDSRGSASYNKNLSQKRANAVKDFLVSKGVDARRIQSVGFGEEKPLASNDDEEEGRELNRRVEFKIIN